MKNSQIDKEVRWTMDILDGINPTDPGPYFYSKLMARMEPTVEIKLVWKIAFVLILLVNAVTFLSSTNETERDNSDPLEQLSSGYFGSDDVFYDLAYNNLNDED